MSNLLQFVANYDDLSTDKGYQFKFHCDKCRNGYLSRYQTSTIGMAGSLLNAAGNIFGGFFHEAGNAAYQMQRAVGGKAHDEALAVAVQEGKQHFKQCTRCGQWVCPEVCWNHQAGLCESCAPDEQERTVGPAGPRYQRADLHQNPRAGLHQGNRLLQPRRHRAVY